MREDIDIKRKTLKDLEMQDIFQRKDIIKVEFYEK